jgi:hypothetical protein
MTEIVWQVGAILNPLGHFGTDAIGLVDVRAVDNTINVVRVDGKLPMESGYLPH